MSYKIKKIFCLFSIIAITFAIFSPILKYQFTNWDDNEILLENKDVRYLDFFHLKKIFTTTFQRTYIPLTLFSFTLEHHFFGFDPFVYYLNNLLLHLAITGMIFVFSLQLGLNLFAASLAALLFGVHPMHVESVAWVTERKDVLYASFYMAAILSYLCYLSRLGIESKGRQGFYLATLILGTLSMLAKPMAVTLPFVLLVVDCVKGRKINKKSVLEKFPLFLVLGALAWVTYSANAEHLKNTFLEGLLIWCWTFIFYLRQFIFPWELLPIYQLPKPINFFQFEYSISFFITLLMIYAAIRLRRYKWFAFSILYYFFSIFLLLRFDDITLSWGPNIVADRFMYLPSVGFCMLFGVVNYKALVYFNKNFIFKQLFLVILLSFYFLIFIKTSSQLKIWHDSERLWSYLVSQTPNNSRGYHNLAEYYMDKGDLIKAREHFQKAILYDPNAVEPYNNLGIIEEREGHLDEAIRYLEEARAIAPQTAAIYNNLGAIYRRKEMWQIAEEHFKKALSLDPKLLEPRHSLAELFLARGEYEEVIITYKEILGIDPYDNGAQVKLINAYLKIHQDEKALALGTEILMKSKDLGLLTDLGGVFALRNKIPVAMAFYTKVLKLDPSYADGYVELGKLFGNMERYKLSIKTWEEGLRLNPNDQRFNELIEQAQQLMK